MKTFSILLPYIIAYRLTAKPKTSSPYLRRIIKEAHQTIETMQGIKSFVRIILPVKDKEKYEIALCEYLSMIVLHEEIT